MFKINKIGKALAHVVLAINMLACTGNNIGVDDENGDLQKISDVRRDTQENIEDAGLSYDGGTVDSEIVDSEVGDGEIIDSEIVDSEVYDGEIIDSEIVDSEVSYGDTVDSEIVDSEVSDGDTVDSEIVDSEVSDGETVDSEITVERPIEDKVTVTQRRCDIETDEDFISPVEGREGDVYNVIPDLPDGTAVKAACFNVCNTGLNINEDVLERVVPLNPRFYFKGDFNKTDIGFTLTSTNQNFTIPPNPASNHDTIIFANESINLAPYDCVRLQAFVYPETVDEDDGKLNTFFIKLDFVNNNDNARIEDSAIEGNTWVSHSTSPLLSFTDTNASWRVKTIPYLDNIFISTFLANNYIGKWHIYSEYGLGNDIQIEGLSVECVDFTSGEQFHVNADLLSLQRSHLYKTINEDHCDIINGSSGEDNCSTPLLRRGDTLDIEASISQGFEIPENWGDNWKFQCHLNISSDDISLLIFEDTNRNTFEYASEGFDTSYNPVIPSAIIRPSLECRYNLPTNNLYNYLWEGIGLVGYDFDTDENLVIPDNELSLIGFSCSNITEMQIESNNIIVNSLNFSIIPSNFQEDSHFTVHVFVEDFGDNTEIINVPLDVTNDNAPSDYTIVLGEEGVTLSSSMSVKVEVTGEHIPNEDQIDLRYWFPTIRPKLTLVPHGAVVHGEDDEPVVKYFSSISPDRGYHISFLGEDNLFNNDNLYPSNVMFSNPYAMVSSTNHNNGRPQIIDINEDLTDLVLLEGKFENFHETLHPVVFRFKNNTGKIIPDGAYVTLSINGRDYIIPQANWDNEGFYIEIPDWNAYIRQGRSSIESNEEDAVNNTWFELKFTGPSREMFELNERDSFPARFDLTEVSVESGDNRHPYAGQIAIGTNNTGDELIPLSPRNVVEGNSFLFIDIER